MKKTKTEKFEDMDAINRKISNLKIANNQIISYRHNRLAQIVDMTYNAVIVDKYSDEDSLVLHSLIDFTVKILFIDHYLMQRRVNTSTISFNSIAKTVYLISQTLNLQKINSMIKYLRKQPQVIETGYADGLLETKKALNQICQVYLSFNDANDKVANLAQVLNQAFQPYYVNAKVKVGIIRLERLTIKDAKEVKA